MVQNDRSTARSVRDWIDTRPVVVEALRLGISNHSALARRIAEDLGAEHLPAIIAACRRYPLTGDGAFREKSVQRLLDKSRVETRTKVATITVVQGLDVLQRLGDVVEEILDENLMCRLIQVSRGTVIVVDEDSVGRFVKRFRESQIVSVRRGLVELAVTSPVTIEETSGLLARLSSVLATRGINIVQAVSCYTDTIFVLDREDMPRAIDSLANVLA
ncbi:MAG: ACT domain-containing protein [Thermoplasmata archaeon]